MIFENIMADHLDEMRQKINRMTEKFPELIPHFSLGHAGLLDNETEKLLEAFCFMLTESEATRKSIIANKIKVFIEHIFPEWYRPEVSTCIAEFNNYSDFERMQALLAKEQAISFECQLNDETIFLSANGGFLLTPFAIVDTQFEYSENEAFLKIVFNNLVQDKSENVAQKIRIFLDSNNPEEIFSLISYIFDPKLKISKFLLQKNNDIFEMDRSLISLPLFDEKITKNNVFFESKNKLHIFIEILNKIHHYFYIDIDFNGSLQSSDDLFQILIPLDKKTYFEFRHMKNFAKTNCIPVFDLYEDNLSNIAITDRDNRNKILISNLKENKIIHITEANTFNSVTKEKTLIPDDLFIESSIKYTSGMSFDLEYNLVFKKGSLRNEIYLMSKGIYTTFIDSHLDIKGSLLAKKGEISSIFGFVLNNPSQSIFYSDILCDSEFLNYIYNLNYFIGKKVNNLDMIIEYFMKIKPYYFNYKDFLFKYLESLCVLKWNLIARMCDKGTPQLVSRYKVKKTEVKLHYFYDRVFEKILTKIAESDLMYEIVRE